MSENLYYRRLSYHAGRGGFAKEGNLVLHLDEPPLVLPEILDIEFGEVSNGEMAWLPYVRQRNDGQRRDTTPPEILLVRGWLAGLLNAVMGAARQVPPPVERRRS